MEFNFPKLPYPRGHRKGKVNYLTDEKIRAMIERWECGEDYTTIAKAFDISPRTAKLICNGHEPYRARVERIELGEPEVSE